MWTFQRACYLSLNPQKDETLETEKAQYVLPDGSTLNVSWTNTHHTLNSSAPSILTTSLTRYSQIGPARFRAPELLFRPDLIGDESSGIHEVLAYAIQKSDMDLRRTLFSTIVLCGGSTLIKGPCDGVSVFDGNTGFYFSLTEPRFFPLGFGERLLTEVKKLAPKDVKIKVCPHWGHESPCPLCVCVCVTCGCVSDLCSPGEAVFYMDRVRIQSQLDIMCYNTLSYTRSQIANVNVLQFTFIQDLFVCL